MSMNWKCRFGAAVVAFRGGRSCVSAVPYRLVGVPFLHFGGADPTFATPRRGTSGSRRCGSGFTCAKVRHCHCGSRIKGKIFFYFRSSALLSLALQRCSVAVLQFSRSISQTLKTVLSLYIYYIYNIYIKIGVIFDLSTTCFGTATLQHCNASSACALSATSAAYPRNCWWRRASSSVALMASLSFLV